jgi:hypothetical protein
MMRTDTMVASGYGEPSSPSDLWTRGMAATAGVGVGLGGDQRSRNAYHGWSPTANRPRPVAPILAGAGRPETAAPKPPWRSCPKQPAGPGGPGFSSHTKAASSWRPDPTRTQRPRPCLVRRIAPGQARNSHLQPPRRPGHGHRWPDSAGQGGSPASGTVSELGDPLRQRLVSRQTGVTSCPYRQGPCPLGNMNRTGGLGLLAYRLSHRRGCTSQPSQSPKEARCGESPSPAQRSHCCC